jgi:hypothetical protein
LSSSSWWRRGCGPPRSPRTPGVGDATNSAGAGSGLGHCRSVERPAAIRSRRARSRAAMARRTRPPRRRRVRGTAGSARPAIAGISCPAFPRPLRRLARRPSRPARSIWRVRGTRSAAAACVLARRRAARDHLGAIRWRGAHPRLITSERSAPAHWGISRAAVRRRLTSTSSHVLEQVLDRRDVVSGALKSLLVKTDKPGIGTRMPARK